MRHPLSLRILLGLSFLLLASGCVGSQPLLLDSQRAAQPPTIDGQAQDWAGTLRPVEGQRFSLGVQNDAEFLYVLFVSSDQGVVSQVMRNGLKMWFDAEGGTAQSFGINFPIGGAVQPDGGLNLPPSSTATPDPEAQRQRFLASLNELEILGEETVRLKVAEAPGIIAQASLAYGTLTYELQMPLQRTTLHTFAIGTLPGTPVGFGIESPTPDTGFRGGRPGQGGAVGGGRPSGAGSIGGRPGQPAGGGRGGFQPVTSLKTWLVLNLSS